MSIDIYMQMKDNIKYNGQHEIYFSIIFLSTSSLENVIKFTIYWFMIYDVLLDGM